MAPPSTVDAAADVHPTSLAELRRWFPDDATCRAWLAELRWADGFACPACGSAEAWRTADGARMCTGCGRKTSVIAGTTFHRSRTPLTTWFAAMWLVTERQDGCSARALQRELGFGSYETAWAWLHKLRRAMVRADHDRLGGVVEVGTTTIAARRGPGGRRETGGTGDHATVAIAVEALGRPDRLGRIRLAHLPGGSRTACSAFVRVAVDADTTVRGGRRRPTGSGGLPGGGPPVDDPAGVHWVAAALEGWVAGTLHHGIALSQLDYYLDEFTFRFNRRTATAVAGAEPGLLWYRLVQQAVASDPHPYHELAAGSLDPYIWD